MSLNTNVQRRYVDINSQQITVVKSLRIQEGGEREAAPSQVQLKSHEKKKKERHPTLLGKQTPKHNTHFFVIQIKSHRGDLCFTHTHIQPRGNISTGNIGLGIHARLAAGALH